MEEIFFSSTGFFFLLGKYVCSGQHFGVLMTTSNQSHRLPLAGLEPRCTKQCFTTLCVLDIYTCKVLVLLSSLGYL